ncbi:hypothetical protein SELMODRAFT_126670 [Selaginella moellendorffii]|uniref:Peroxidase n=1 Tax=Selaginella moellendorffii TaxID=88036 RepID=D8SWR7_SELML|nr:hypothetical protein SELMODRAFT_126670 [Selaginella moellendorffii]
MLLPLLLLLECIVLISLPRLGSIDAQKIQVGFYSTTCPQAESIVKNVVSSAVSANRGLAAGLLRLQFHDCFVQGCDASVLIDTTPSTKGGAEKDAPPNKTLRGFEVIDAAKAQLEAKCPGTVSCADILAFATRDAVVQVGGPRWDVPAGRRDGRISSAAEATSSLPDPSFSINQLTQRFAAKGLSQDNMITLSGKTHHLSSHTIGVAHCKTFINRLYGFSSSADTDPSLDPTFAQSLKAQCPRENPNPNTVVSLDPTPNTFDNSYYSNLALGRGLLASDELLFTDGSTTLNVALNSFFGSTWLQKFPDAMVKMSLIEVKTGSQGEIRKNCRRIN